MVFIRSRILILSRSETGKQWHNVKDLDGLGVGRRARYHPEDLGRGDLLLECLGHLCMGFGEGAVRERFFSCSFLHSRTFSIAMTAWSAKVSRRATCWSVNGLTSIRRMT